MSIRIRQANLKQTQQSKQFRLRCPECGQKSILALAALPDGTAERMGVGDAIVWGTRVCPDPECGALIFIVSNARSSIIESFPPESIDFDSTDLPPAVLETFKEAVECHAHACYKASAINGAQDT